MPLYVLAVKKSLANERVAVPLPHQKKENMQRTEKYLKSKGIKTHKPTFAHAYWMYKYDRNYVANHWGDADIIPFSRGSWRSKWVETYEHPNRFLRHYLERYFCKQVGRNVDDVFREFCKFGWNHMYDMYFYWEQFVDPDYPQTCYQIDNNGLLTQPCKPVKHKHLCDWNISGLFDDDEDDEYYKPIPKRPRASEKRLTRKQLEYNEKVIAAKNAVSCYSYGHELLGELYVEIKHKVSKCKVFLKPFPVHYWSYVPVKVMGIYREEYVFYDETGTQVLIPCVEYYGFC